MIVFAGCRVNTFKDSGRFGINGLITENTKENHNQNIQLRLIYIKTVNILYKIKIFKQYKAVREINFRKRTDWIYTFQRNGQRGWSKGKARHTGK